MQQVAQVGNVPCDELEWGSRVKSGAPPWQAQTQTQQIWEPQRKGLRPARLCLFTLIERLCSSAARWAPASLFLQLPTGHPVHHPFGAVRHLRAFALRPAMLEMQGMSTWTCHCDALEID